MSNDLLLVKLQAIHLKPQGDRGLATASRHNKRTLAPGTVGNIDPTRSHRNLSLFGLPSTPEEVIALARSLMAEKGIQPKRIDTTVAVEGVFSLREDRPDMARYFTDCATWLRDRFEGELLSADVHLDEDHPHCHVIVLLPLFPPGTNGSKVIGDLPTMNGHITDFFEKVARGYGLSLPPPPLRGAAKRALEKQVHDHLRRIEDPAIESAIWGSICAGIAGYPERTARELGIPIAPSQRQGKTLEQLLISSGKGAKTAAADSIQHRRMVDRAAAKSSAPRLLIEVESGAAADRLLSCVEVAEIHPQSSASPDPQAAPQTAPRAAQPAQPAQPQPERLPVRLEPATTRHRDADCDPRTWDSTTGEFVKPPPVPQSARDAADALIAKMLRGEPVTA